MGGAALIEVNPGRRRGLQAFTWASQGLEHGQAGAAEPRAGQQPRKGGRSFAIRSQYKDSRTGLQMRTDKVERAAMQRELSGLRQGPAKPRGGKREGRGRRYGYRLARLDVPQQKRSDAVKEWGRRRATAHVPDPPS